MSGAETIRAFAGIALPQAERARLAAWQEALPSGKRVASENLHLTLVFLGDVSATGHRAVDTAFRAIAAPAFELRLSGLDVFGTRRPGVVYAGLEESAALRALQGRVEGAARAAGLPLDERSFVPHVTIARPARKLPHAVFTDVLAAYAEARGDPFTVSEFRLYRSRRSPQGPRYETLARYPLQAPDCP